MGSDVLIDVDNKSTFIFLCWFIRVNCSGRGCGIGVGVGVGDSGSGSGSSSNL